MLASFIPCWPYSRCEKLLFCFCCQCLFHVVVHHLQTTTKLSVIHPGMFFLWHGRWRPRCVCICICTYKNLHCNILEAQEF
uniref:Uncharacterized protein n=1 Tax=Anguilla anguilla TaxID=7936 RepID=A0A0E9WX20_ANGAN